jgi:hypothetical protein
MRWHAAGAKTSTGSTTIVPPAAILPHSQEEQDRRGGEPGRRLRACEPIARASIRAGR